MFFSVFPSQAEVGHSHRHRVLSSCAGEGWVLLTGIEVMESARYLRQDLTRLCTEVLP
jgi:hypothetical protein